MDALQVLTNVQQFDVVAVASEAVSECADLIVYKNREQLMEGKFSDSSEITPSYLDDPYFKTKEAAQRYSDWKDEITPNPKRRKGTPNLFIVGTYQESISLEVKGRDMITSATFDAAPSIESKYGEDKLYGLDDDRRQEVIDEKLEDAFYYKAHRVTGL